MKLKNWLVKIDKTWRNKNKVKLNAGRSNNLMKAQSKKNRIEQIKSEL